MLEQITPLVVDELAFFDRYQDCRHVCRLFGEGFNFYLEVKLLRTHLRSAESIEGGEWRHRLKYFIVLDKEAAIERAVKEIFGANSRSLDLLVEYIWEFGDGRASAAFVELAPSEFVDQCFPRVHQNTRKNFLLLCDVISEAQNVAN